MEFVEFLRNVTWTKFCDFYTDLLKGINVEKKYPKYWNWFQTGNFLTTLVASTIVHNEDLQDCINRFVDVLLNHMQQNSDYCYVSFDIIRALLKNSNFGKEPPVFPYDRILWKKESADTLAQEVKDYWIRGALLEEFEPNELQDVADWDKVQAKRPRELNLMGPITDELRFSVLKYYSEYLQRLHGNHP